MRPHLQYTDDYYLMLRATFNKCFSQKPLCNSNILRISNRGKGHCEMLGSSSVLELLEGCRMDLVDHLWSSTVVIIYFTKNLKVVYPSLDIMHAQAKGHRRVNTVDGGLLDVSTLTLILGVHAEQKALSCLLLCICVFDKEGGISFFNIDLLIKQELEEQQQASIWKDSSSD